MSGMSLRQILAGVAINSAVPEVILNSAISGISHDSRQVKPGFLFVAIKGRDNDGHNYLALAFSNGAKAALVERINPQAPLIQILVEDARQAMSMAAMNYYDNPASRMNIIGITGTNGKTTTSYLVEALLKPDVGIIGTVETRFGGVSLASNMTTPDPLSLAGTLRDMREAGIHNLVMEVSSHALEQKRVDGLNFSGAVFTSFSRDHLDYHHNMDNYFAAKKRLFAELLPRSQKHGLKPWAVVNMEDGRRESLLEALQRHNIKFMTYGNGGDVYVAEASHSLEGVRAVLETPKGRTVVASRLIGEFNLQNVTAATAAGLCMGMSLDDIARKIAACASVPGRLERVLPGVKEGPVVLVDYAHTDDALRKALKVIKGLTPGQVICVFGAGGNRDHGKRPLMGKAVAEVADIAVVTSDNPRMEEPVDIIGMILPGLISEGFSASHSWPEGARQFVVEPDRAKAISLAVRHARHNDVILIAGKGHENYQTIGKDNIHFDDREKAAHALIDRDSNRV